MQTKTETRYGHTLGLRLLRALAGEGRFVFTTAESKPMAQNLGLSDNHLRLLLSLLENGGWLTRLRRGLYAITGGVWDIPVHPFVVATRLVTPSAISHWSAMNFHGLTEQIPQGITATTTRKVVTPSMRRGRDDERRFKHAWEIGGVRYEFVTVNPEHFFGIEEVWIDAHFQVPITDKERTMLDGFVAPRRFGGMGEVLGLLDEQIHHLNLEKLVAYALRYGKASVAKRLGWSLEQVGAPESVVAPLQTLPISGFRLLDPTRPLVGPYDSRWHIQNNLTATPA